MEFEVVAVVIHDGYHIQPMAQRTVTLYSRPGCHLCDDARAVLERVRLRIPFDLIEIDIEADDVLVAAYGIRIPVVAVDGRDTFEYRVDPGELEAVLRSV